MQAYDCKFRTAYTFIMLIYTCLFIMPHPRRVVTLSVDGRRLSARLSRIPDPFVDHAALSTVTAFVFVLCLF